MTSVCVKHVLVKKLVTLDGEERDLETNDLVITVADKPVALAGVMGGQTTEISENSSRVVLEAAVFNGKSIRKTADASTFVLNHLLALKRYQCGNC